jgi:hypothetical protein
LDDDSINVVTEQELLSALKQFKNKTDLKALFSMCQKYRHIPEEWKTAIIFLVFKIGIRNDCGDYRGISLLNTAVKYMPRFKSI